MTISFTIAFICHGDMQLLHQTIPQNIESLCSRTSETYDLVLVIDGAEKVDHHSFLSAANKWGINELRFRSRMNNYMHGDPSNNGHAHLFSDKTPYLLTLEGDIVFFNLRSNFDPLKSLRELFERHPDLCIATRMDDHDCWVWKLEQVGPIFEDGILSVNRVASHFLVYHTDRCGKYLSYEQRLNPDTYYDDSRSWFNYEDLISKAFSYPNGPGIAYLDSFPIRVYHCDRKIEHGSPFYTKDLKVKLEEFHRRKEEVMTLMDKKREVKSHVIDGEVKR